MRMTARVSALAALLAPGLGFATPGHAQNTNADLAKQLSNPVANLISVPLQYNYNDGFGDGGGRQNYVNFQPVVPVSLNANWNVIIRTILPVIDQYDMVPGSGTQFGLGDTTQSFFFSPKAPGPGGLIYGVGPAFLYPTATEEALGTGKWGAGPTIVALKQEGGWTYGVLANHIWSVTGQSAREDLSNTFLQPFASYTTAKATTYTLNTESTYDWKDNQWSVPINAMVTQLLKVGDQRIQVGGGLRYWAESPEGAADGWGARAVLTFLFPAG